MQKEYLKFGLVSGLIAGVVNFLIGMTSLFSGFLMDFVILGICVFGGTYAGLWIIGRIRNPSFHYGFLVFLFCFATVALFWLAGAAYYGYYNESLRWFLNELALPYAVISFVGVFIGIAIIRKSSPSFCPNCGFNLPAGRADCSKCGKRLEAELIGRWIIIGVVGSVTAIFVVSLVLSIVFGYPIGI